MDPGLRRGDKPFIIVITVIAAQAEIYLEALKMGPGLRRDDAVGFLLLPWGEGWDEGVVSKACFRKIIQALAPHLIPLPLGEEGALFNTVIATKERKTRVFFHGSTSSP
ncbi:MAG: hypothetical protein COA84_09605 [Robiginitomaculum sp.]|nr:MAG: hypothetical protein COA84_09605 [Robiginitomaculum sp.]